MALRVLVTGYGGFLGSEVTRQLVARGDTVVGLGRSEYPHLKGMPITHMRGDITDATLVRRAVRGVDAVIHTAAKAGVWGPWREYYAINTQATRHVVDACRREGTPVLVYCSSPSVTFDGRDQSGVDESVPYPKRWLCAYPQTKALGEQAVLGANDPPRLWTAALRPHLIWGVDDPHLFPRLIARARSGRLRIVGTGTNRMDTVHVVNAAVAHLAAVDRLFGESRKASTGPQESASGRAYFITQDEPVGCWDWIAQVLRIAGVEPPRRRISFATAWRLGHALEWAYRLSGRRSEPPMTRFLAAQLARDHYFDISAARRLLGYEPRVSTAEGLAELARRWT